MTAFIDSLRTTFTGYLRYRGQSGHISFLVHRLTGLGTLLFLIIHILDTSTVYFIPELYDEAIAIYQSTPFLIGEIGLVFSVIFHGVNGLRIAIVDMWMPDRWTIAAQQSAARWTWALSIILWLPAAAWMFRNLLLHNFGIGG